MLCAKNSLPSTGSGNLEGIAANEALVTTKKQAQPIMHFSGVFIVVVP
jgi:hypothetical protein